MIVDRITQTGVFEPFADRGFRLVGSAVDVDNLGKINIAPLKRLEGEEDMRDLL